MTNEEAIEILRTMPIAAISDMTYEQIFDALNLAIKALELASKPLFIACTDGKIEPIRIKGKWIIHQTGLLLTAECDKCHCQVGTINMNFCPNCGADMREKDNDKVN